MGLNSITVIMHIKRYFFCQAILESIQKNKINQLIDYERDFI